MRVLIDECTPRALKKLLMDHGHECRTVQEAGWAGKQNGDLLSLAEAVFDVFVTVDTNLRYQQNLTGRKLALVVLGSNIWTVVRDYASAIAAKVDAATPGSYGFIEMALPPKPRRNSG